MLILIKSLMFMLVFSTFCYAYEEEFLGDISYLSVGMNCGDKKYSNLLGVSGEECIKLLLSGKGYCDLLVSDFLPSIDDDGEEMNETIARKFKNISILYGLCIRVRALDKYIDRTVILNNRKHE